MTPTSIADPTELVSSVLRTTIAVKNIDNSLPLYRDVLGLKVSLDMAMDGPALNQIVGTQGKKARIVILSSGDAAVGNIALFEYLDQATALEPDPISKDPQFAVGDVALVMNTTDIEAIHSKVKQAGYVIVSPPTVLFQRPNMKSQTYEMMFLSPDGVAINLIQRGVPNP